MTNLIINFWPLGRGEGYAAGLAEILQDELFEKVRIVEAFDDLSPELQVERFLNLLEESNPSKIFLMGSPTHLGRSRADFHILSEATRGRTIIYWDSDGWGRGKPFGAPLRFWAFRADYFFHAGGVPNPLEKASTATLVRYAPQTYCHVLFGKAEQIPPSPKSEDSVLMIANNVTRTGIPIPGLTGIGGGLGRYVMARTARAALGSEFEIAGRGWPVGWRAKPMEFSSQIEGIRSHGYSLSWDHFNHRSGYYSDRLPISLLAGRPHVSNRHQDLGWLRESGIGYYPVNSAASAVKVVKNLRQRPEAESRETELLTWEWARKNLSSRQLARFILSTLDNSVTPPIGSPWDQGEAPVNGLRQ